MDEIGISEARDHVEMVDRILAEVHPRLCSGGEFFVVWGVISAFITVISGLIAQGEVVRFAAWSIPIAVVAGAIFSIVRGRQTRRSFARTPIVQREFFNVLWLTLGMAFIVNVAVFRIFPGLASAAIWSVAETTVLLYIGMHGNRRAQLAGVLVVVSLIAANFTAANVAVYVLAAGMLVGYTGFGLSEMLARD